MNIARNMASSETTATYNPLLWLCCMAVWVIEQMGVYAFVQASGEFNASCILDLCLGERNVQMCEYMCVRYVHVE